MPLAPPPHVRLANVDGDLVVFDLRHDAYLAVVRDSAAPVLSALSEEPFDHFNPVLAELLESGLLLDGTACWQPDTGCRPAALPDQAAETGDCRLWLAVPFLLALAKTLASYGRRKDVGSLLRQAPVAAFAPSPETMAVIVAQFTRLRSLVPGTGRCLIQSMLLTRLLAQLGIMSELVFGVRTHPFEAHCWVEWDTYVLNDSPDHCSWFTVIARF